MSQTRFFALIALAAGGCMQSIETPEDPVLGGGIVITGERWDLAGFAVGALAGNHDPVEGAMRMPDAIALSDGTLRMYYTQEAAAPIGCNVLVAESRDRGVTWTPRATPALIGGVEDADRMRLVGGPSVIRLADGRWRMFTRSSQMMPDGASPSHHIRTAISTDGGLTFKDEGVVIDNKAHDASSPWASIGHGRVYQVDDGTWAGAFTVQREAGQAADIALFTSSDADARRWTYVRTLYVGWHDPVVIPRGGQYLMVAQYLDQYSALMVSHDGLHWYPEVSKLDLYDQAGAQLSGGKAHEFGAVDTDDGVLLYATFTAPGGMTSVARFHQVSRE